MRFVRKMRRDTNFDLLWWNEIWTRRPRASSPAEEERTNMVLSLIPGNRSSVLDIGCGNGMITNRLAPQHNLVVGLDPSQEAMKYVTTQKIRGDAEHLPFVDRSFDLVLCLEVLEHFPLVVHERIKGEIQRIANKYILITVPNNENILRGYVKCPECGYTFHPSGHHQSFRWKDMPNLFPSFSCRHLATLSPVQKRVYPALIIRVGQIVGLIPRFKLVQYPSLCPRCGFTPSPHHESTKEAKVERGNYLFYAIRYLARLLIHSSKEGRWLIALYERESGSNR